MDANPGPKHEERRRTLDALAILGGCREPLLPFLPDGRRPDVLRFDRARRHIFVGDAKHTETPGCRDTRLRLGFYASWLQANALVAGIGTLALCHPADAGGRWLTLLEVVAGEQGFTNASARQRLLDAETVVSWLEFDLPRVADVGQVARSPRVSAAPTWSTTA